MRRRGSCGRKSDADTDADRAEVLSAFEAAWLNLISGLHHNLPIGAVGKQVSGLAIWLWHSMMRGAAWKILFRIDSRRAQAVNFQLHRSTGLLANAFLLFLAFAGICLAFPDTFRGAVEVENSAARRPLEVYVQAALREVPGGHECDLRAEGSNQVTLDPSTAGVLAVDRYAGWSSAKKAAQAVAPLHYAEWGGGIIRMIWCAAGMAPTLLFLSCVAIWWKASRPRRPAHCGASATGKNTKESVLATS